MSLGSKDIAKVASASHEESNVLEGEDEDLAPECFCSPVGYVRPEQVRGDSRLVLIDDEDASVVHSRPEATELIQLYVKRRSASSRLDAVVGI